MSTSSSTGSTTTPSDPSDDTVFWTDMEYVQQEQAINTEQDMEEEDALEGLQMKEADYRLNQIENNMIGQDGGNDASGILPILDAPTPPPSTVTPIGLASGAQAPSTSNSATKMNNSINSV